MQISRRDALASPISSRGGGDFAGVEPRAGLLPLALGAPLGLPSDPVDLSALPRLAAPEAGRAVGLPSVGRDWGRRELALAGALRLGCERQELARLAPLLLLVEGERELQSGELVQRDLARARLLTGRHSPVSLEVALQAWASSEGHLMLLDGC